MLNTLTKEDILKAIEDLPVEFRAVVVLVLVEGFSYKEAAEILDIPIGTVMSRLWRGRRLLQKSLWEYSSTRRNDSERKNQEGWTAKKS